MRPGHDPQGSGLRGARPRAGRLLLLVAALVAVGLAPGPARAGFTDVTAGAGIDVFAVHSPTTVEIFSGGVAAGDYDHDGWIDLYVTRGQAGFPCLYRNRGDGTFEDATVTAGLTGATGLWSGATFADVDGDGWLDAVLLGILGVPPRLYLNRRDGTFEQASGTGLSLSGNSFSSSFADVDRDGDLDMFVGRWGTYWNDLAQLTERTGHLWLNDGTGRFTDASGPAGLSAFTTLEGEVVFDWWTFTGNFADVDRDGWLDLLVTGDFGNSKVLHNRGDGTFEPVFANGLPDDENGMGGAVGDVDGDGDLDWFVSAIFDPAGPQPDWGASGNRLYLNDGTGRFEDGTTAAGVREGGWGWGSTFADLDGDGDVDLVHANGYSSYWGPTFAADPTRVFLSNGDGTFVDAAASLGAATTGDDRGVVAFDYDRDGDVDLFLSPNQGGARLLRNDGPSAPTITAKLRGRDANTEAIGARLELDTAAGTQVRQLRAGGNFASQDPAEAVFGLGMATSATELRVAWPNGTQTTLANVRPGRIVLSEPAPGDAGCTASAPANACMPGSSSTRSTNECLLEWRVDGVALARDRAGAPIAKVSCREGDPACDAGGPVDSCLFTVAACLNNRDPRLPACGPSDVASFEVRSPRKTSTLAFDRNANKLIASALGPSGGVGIVPGVFGNATPNHCETMQIEVRLANGGLRPAKMTIDLRVASSDGRTDGDKLLLTCLPRS
jgi:hypothetical protein